MEELGERVRSGWTRLYPLMPRDLEAAREIVRKQWELEHGPAQDKSVETTEAQRLEAEQQKKAAEQQKNESLRQTQNKDWGQSH